MTIRVVFKKDLFLKDKDGKKIEKINKPYYKKDERHTLLVKEAVSLQKEGYVDLLDSQNNVVNTKKVYDDMKKKGL